MSLKIHLFMYLISITGIYAVKEDTDILFYDDSEHKNVEKVDNLLFDITKGLESNISDVVSIQMYYETLCPASKEFYIYSLAPVVQKLGPYLNVTTYPYGNSETSQKDGKYIFKCQHGPRECYGNKLHACTIDLLKNATQAVMFNSCMMKSRKKAPTSNNEAADRCGVKQNVDSAPIKECAKGGRGHQLMKYYSDESNKVNFKYVPYVLINGIENDRNNFLKDVCAAFPNKPPPCREEKKARKHCR